MCRKRRSCKGVITEGNRRRKKPLDINLVPPGGNWEKGTSEISTFDYPVRLPVLVNIYLSSIFVIPFVTKILC